MTAGICSFSTCRKSQVKWSNPWFCLKGGSGLRCEEPPADKKQPKAKNNQSCPVTWYHRHTVQANTSSLSDVSPPEVVKYGRKIIRANPARPLASVLGATEASTRSMGRIENETQHTKRAELDPRVSSVKALVGISTQQRGLPVMFLPTQTQSFH